MKKPDTSKGTHFSDGFSKGSILTTAEGDSAIVTGIVGGFTIEVIWLSKWRLFRWIRIKWFKIFGR